MGVGFIIGGFCPGTSVCAAAIGKLDGLAFVLGGGLGVLAFAEGYPMFEKVFLAEAWGPVLINEMLGMSKIAFAFILTAVAVAAFYFTRLIENRVNGIHPKLTKERVVIYTSAVAIAFVLLIFISIMPDSKHRLETRINKELNQKEFTAAEVPADKLASEIVSNYYKINIIDVRNPEAFKAYHLPFAINIPVEKMNEREWKKILDQKHKTNYYYSDDQQVTRKAYLLAEHIGKADNYILTESSESFNKMFSDLVPPLADASKKEINVYNFRKKAATDMATLVEALKNSTQPVVAKTTKIKGGC